ncbi:Endonuclease YncB, thermonuclease family [Loktanella sp. DSM 29012]|uniref:thermonuclease family protein n=1 Tax=Loktanella sp. DSM 29012 TaxID=1881056 RepID=UPI0008D76382|nr:thermonuclease family protein [Loktanella sp. DSM 29012]SEQ04939.1 Endonuclease YncB, thermonuclease family [Loktanella sp. DSM 29012]
MRILLTICLLFCAAPLAAQISGPARVIDGDTIHVGETRIRLNGIDAPEAGQDCRSAQGFPFSCGSHATDGLRALIAGRAVSCAPLDVDRYGRTVARCTAGGVDIGQQMVRNGLAIAYRRYDTVYVPDEDAARRSGAGFWSAQMQRPSDFRAQEQVRDAPPGGCVIKGNISSSGRIYHVPGNAFYDETRISPSRGERWFCTEAEARAAGWRAARR